MIPDIPQIRDSLAALRVEKAAPVVANDRQLTICPKRHRLHPTKVVAEDDTAIILSQDPSAPMNLTRLIDRVAEELHKQNHAHSTPRTDRRVSLASKVLGMSIV